MQGYETKVFKKKKKDISTKKIAWVKAYSLRREQEYDPVLASEVLNEKTVSVIRNMSNEQFVLPDDSSPMRCPHPPHLASEPLGLMR